jgi:VanZ family protein
LSQCDYRSPAIRPILTRRHYWWLGLGFLVLVVYGSLVPFDFTFRPLDEQIQRYRAALAEPVRFESRSDWAANVLLFIPLSFLLIAARAVDREPKAGWSAGLIVLPLCTLLSAAIEFTQLYFPSRTTSLNDVVAESIGGLLGTALWLAGGQKITLWLRRFWVDLGGQGSAGSRLWAYIIFLALVHVMPMDLTISPAEIYHKYKEGRVRLNPFASWPPGSSFAIVQKCLTNVAFFLPAGVLLTGLSHPFWRRGRNWAPMLGLGLGLAGLIEFMQLFVYSRYFESMDVVTGGLAVLAGWRLGLVYRRLQPEPARGARVPIDGISATGRAVAYRVLVVWLVVLVFVKWQPFDFNLSGEYAARRLKAMAWLPFESYQVGDYLNSFDQICAKTVLFLPVGALLAVLGFGQKGRYGDLWVILPVIVFTTLLEAGKLLLTTRGADPTDVLIETLGAWLGFRVTYHISKRGNLSRN